MSLRDPPDEALMDLYVLGDSKAFVVLYGRYRRPLYGYIRSKVSKKELADEIFQATFFNLHRSRARYRHGLKFDAWLFSICRNAMRDYFRKLKTSERQNETFYEEEISSEMDESIEVSSALTEKVAQLPKDQRQIIEQRVIEEREFSEIATALSTTRENVRQILSRALRKLRMEAENEKSRKR